MSPLPWLTWANGVALMRCWRAPAAATSDLLWTPRARHRERVFERLRSGRRDGWQSVVIVILNALTRHIAPRIARSDEPTALFHRARGGYEGEEGQDDGGQVGVALNCRHVCEARGRSGPFLPRSTSLERMIL
jgi:hypothetical protein